jgi:hypothetical protein
MSGFKDVKKNFGKLAKQYGKTQIARYPMMQRTRNAHFRRHHEVEAAASLVLQKPNTKGRPK